MPVRRRQPTASTLIVRRVTSAEARDLSVELRTLVESLTDEAVFVLDLDGCVASWNRGAERMEGYTSEEIVGRHFSVFHPPDDLANDRPARVLTIARETGKYEEHGYRVRKDGSRFWARVVLTALRAPDGTLIGYGKVTRDETQQREAHEALRRSEERLRLMIEAVEDYAIFILDPDGRIASWNSGAQKLKQYTAAEAIGRHFSMFYGEEDRARRHPEHEIAVASEVGRYAEEGWRFRKDGSRFWASVVITALRDPHGTLIGFAKVTRDMSDRRAAEEAMRALNEDLERRVRERTAEIEAANREIEAFSYSVSHDLRAPLRSLDGFSRLVLERGATLDAESRDYLTRIRAAAQRMSELIDAMLSLARLTRAPIVRQEVDVTAIVQSVVAELRAAEPDRQVAVTLAPDLRAHGDPALLRVVFENLLRNAWKFTRRNAEAHVEVGRTNDELWVKDDGVGFPENRADKLFVPFQRLHKVTDFEGTGIGLATVQRIVLRHGGTIRAESSPGGGAKFSFTLGAPR